MERPPRDNNLNILSGGVGWNILYQATIQVVILMIMFVLALRFYDNITATTMVFYTLNLIQVFHAFNLKTNHSLKTINIFKNKMFNISFGVSILLITLVATIPFMRMIFGLANLTVVQWLIVLACSISIIPFVEFIKFLQYKFKTERVK